MSVQTRHRSNLSKASSSLIGIPEGNENYVSGAVDDLGGSQPQVSGGPVPTREASVTSLHGVRFADHLTDVKPPTAVNSEARVAAVSGLSMHQRAHLVGKDLMSRLYDRPENSQAIVTVRRQEAVRKQAEGAADQSANAIPRPPSGKSRPPMATFRTTMLKKDIDRRRQKSQQGGLSVQMFQKGNVNKVLPAIEANGPTQDEEENTECVVGSCSPVSDDSKSDLSELKLLEKPQEKKVVTFSEPALTPDIESQSSPLQKSPDELPTPLPVQSVLYDIPMSPVLRREEKTAPASRASSGKGSRQADLSVVLTYLQKNIYDNKEPENDNFLEVVVGLREQIGWIVSIPRHGPGSRKAMDNLQDKPDPEKDIEAAVAAKDDNGQFVYALPSNHGDPRGRYNPYDLKVVSANSARKQSVYFTGSASYVSRVVESGSADASDQTRTLQWFWERRLFYAVHELPVFVKFRIWKAFQVWRLNVRHVKNAANKLVLTKTLFAANEILQGALLHIRSLCESASGSLTGHGQGTAAISLVRLSKSATLTLEEFVSEQQQQGEAALTQINALRDAVIDLLWKACSTVAEMEGITHGIRPESDKPATTEASPDKSGKKSKETREVKYKIKTKYGEIPVYEKKSKQKKKEERPSYAQVAEWRKILHRLSYFLRSVDFLLVEMLRRLVITATRMLVKFMVASYNTGMVEDDQEFLSSDESDDDRDSPRLVRPQSKLSVLTSQSSRSGMSSDFKSKSRSTAQVAALPKYVIPHFDFDKKEEPVKAPDIDEILQEIEESNNVEEESAAVLSIQLVLNIPAQDVRSEHGNDTDNSSMFDEHSQNHDGKHKKTRSKNSSEGRKAVKFTDTNGDSGSDSDEYYDDDDYEDEEVEVKPQNRFAYPDPRLNKPAPLSKVSIALSPSEEEIEAGIRGVVSGFENTVGQVVSMLKEPKLAVFYSPPKHDLRLKFDEEIEDEEEENSRPWPDLEMLFSDDPEYQGLITELMQYTATCLDMILEYTHSFDKYTQMVDMARSVNVETSMKRKMWSTDEFQHVLSVHTEQIRDMMSMVKRRRHGLMNVHSQGFCDSCLPFPVNVVQAVSDKLPVIALKHNEDLLTIIKGACKRLDKFPSTVEEFVERLSFLGKMASEMPALEREYAVVIKLYTIAKDFEVKIHPEEHALYQTLSPSFQHLKTLILYAEAKKEDNIRKFSTHLDTLIQSIRVQITDIKNRVRDPVLLHSDTMAMSAIEKINTLTDEVTTLASKARSYANYQERFGNSLTSNKKQFSEEFLLSDRTDDNSTREMQADLSEIERDLTLRRLLWESAEEWDKLSAEWTNSAFDVLQVDSLQKNVNRFSQTVYMLDKGLPHNEVVPRLKEKVTGFKLVMPCITSLRNPSLRSRHWEQIERIIGKSIVRNKEFTLGDLLDMNITKFKERVQDISTTASNEATLERMLMKVIDLWQGTDFRLVSHSSGAVQIIAGADDILAMLEESQVTIGTIRGSRYVTPIKGTVEEWERKLALFARTLDEWMVCQRNWLYLEQIFTTPDIQRQLPSESKLFGGVDRTWKDIMRRTEDRPNALRSATAPGVLEMLQAANSSLEKIHKCLEDYLETKRLVFPRFYFLSNDDLLDILAQSKNPDAVQPHLGKCFGNIKNIEIKMLPRQPPTVKTITSAEGEIISMPKNVRARGPVEQWLGSVETGMFDTVKKHLKVGLQDWLGISHEEWVLKHPGQVVLTVAQIMFNKEVVAAFTSPDPVKSINVLKDKMVDTLNTLASLVSSNLMSHKRLSINALLTIDVHNRDIIFSMIDNKIVRADDFEWTRQLRYEWDEQSNNCNVLQSHASFVYGYEYLGCSPRLVITPLTDRCYLTLTGALHLHLGGSPAGPAGTGKTETVKDLAKAMGKQCVVFNCSEGLDFKMLGKFFSGLAQSGSWCCFDEFNRIETEVLSVVAQQIHTIKTAKDQMAPRFVFEGRDIRLNMTCGFFITMNPSYAGRVELPDNLKSLFRQVAMMVPDYALIAEIMLFSEGFTAAQSLSTKVVNLYQLASKQLSQQNHYDFGMRAIKSVLVMAGLRKRQLQDLEGETARTDISQEEEAHILIHALRDANLPKFLAEDVPLFESIMADLFPGITPPDPPMEALEKAISMSVRDQGLQHWQSQQDKVKQLYSQILVRHGVMLVGPTGGGKTTIRNILQRALVLLPTITVDDDHMIALHEGKKSKSGRRQSIFIHNRTKKGHVETFAINPKCIKLGELYGETDPNTFEWSDGLIASVTRRFARDQLTGHPDDPLRPTSASTLQSASRLQTPQGTASTTPTEVDETQTTSDQVSMIVPEPSMDTIPTDWRWIVLDGPVDTIWVENLNTVLDDSKVLCLANGERIALTHGMRLLFEVDDLCQASPATVSRCAMVYLDPVYLGWKPYVKTWIQRLPREMPESGKKHLQALFDHSIDRGLSFMKTFSKQQVLVAPDMSFVSCLCNILSAYFEFMTKHGGFGQQDKEVLRPGSAESESSHSRSSSRSGSRTDRRRKKSLRKKKEEMKTIAENAAVAKGSFSDDSAKQYFLQRNPSSLIPLLGKLFVFAFTWSFGGNFQRQDDLDDDAGIGRKGGDRRDYIDVDIASEFDHFIHEVFEVEPPLGVRLPASSRNIFSYFVNMDTGNFVAWETLVPSTQSLIEKGTVITLGETMGVASEIQGQQAKDGLDIVPTVDTVRYSFLMGLLLVNKNPVLLTGESGVGKTAMVKHLLGRLEKEGGTSLKSGTVLGSVLNFTDKNKTLLDNISSLTKMSHDDSETQLDAMLGGGRSRTAQQTGLLTCSLQYSAQTSAARTQQSLISKLIKKGRDTLGAPRGKKVIMFIDDLNMPAQEQYGAQPPLELLRQFLDLGGFYDTKKLVWKDVLDVTLVTACGPTGGGRHPISQRLLKHFCMLALPQPSTRSLQHIYQVQLGRFFHDADFMPEVKECLFPLVSASIAIYYRMCGSMRPTPAKSHYTFNIRDLSQVVSGLLEADGSVIVNSDNCAQLFAHEATRVFHDRLVDESDRAHFFKALSDNLHDHFKVKWTAADLQSSPILFCDFLDSPDSESSSRVYKSVSDHAKLSAVLEELYMRQTISNPQAPQLVFFKEAVEHILRAARIFRSPGGHMLLVGMDGTGKSTTVQLAAYVCNCELFKITLSRSYNLCDFRDDLKKVCIKSGVKGQNTVFLLTDADLVKEAFLEDVNCILNSGEVPDLFDNEEIDGISMELKAAAAVAQIPDTRQDVYNFFIQRVKKNLHIVLAMSPAGSKFRQRCRMNPSLINCCAIDWYNEWDRTAMKSVAKIYLQNTDFTCEGDRDAKEIKEDIADMCVDVHMSVRRATLDFWEEVKRRYYVTPSSYMELIRLYASMLNKKKEELMKNRHRLLVGLSSLSDTTSLVGTMQDELIALGPKITAKAKDTEVLLQQLEKDQEAVDQVREIVEAEEAVMKKETQVVQDYADDCQRDLASVIPALQVAIESLDSLDKADIAEIRVYSNPPFLVVMVLSAVCILLREKPDWASAKQVIADPLFLKKLVNFDKNNVPEKVFTKLRKFSSHENFTPDKVGKVSLACKSMCQWVLALQHYHEVYKMAKPKQRRVEEAREALQLAQKNLAQKQASLGKIQGHLQSLQQQYQDSVNQRESLQQRQVLTELRLQRASVLIEAVSDEKVRWSESVEDLDFKLNKLVGDMLVSAAAVAYLGTFNHKYRHQLLDEWTQKCHQLQIPLSKDYNFVSCMADANLVLRWYTEGLPQDMHSTESAIIVKNSRCWPLLIDPQGQASIWIREMEGNKLKVLKASDLNYMRTMERAIRVGDPVLLQDVNETLDPSLKPILLQETVMRGGHQVMRLGDTEIEYNSNFRLYLTTSLGNPHYLPAVCIQVTLINFTVTFEGLQEQLLSGVVRQEQPKLEMERNTLLENIASDRLLLRELEDKTLELLHKSQGHLLDDQDLVETLQKSKTMSEEIVRRVDQSEEAEKKLNLARHKYLPVAARGAVLYFVLADLTLVDVMYQFSLSWFQNIFISCIGLNQIRPQSGPHTPLSGTMRPSSTRDPKGTRSADKQVAPQDLNKHMDQMISRLTSSVYKIVCRALFAQHQLMFSFMLCSGIMRSGKSGAQVGYIGHINEDEWFVFLQGQIMASMMEDSLLKKYDGLSPMQRLDLENNRVGPTRPRWVTDQMWRQCQHLEFKFSCFEQLCRCIMSCHIQWQTLIDDNDPYHLLETPFSITKYVPESKDRELMIVFPWQNLSPFQRLLLLKILRPSALTSAVRTFVAEQMGDEFVAVGHIDLKQVFEEANAKTPLIFLLSPGSDPASMLLRFAKELRGSTLHVDMISLGRGQGPKAEELISKAQILKGRWLFLQNCHLAASWMPRLQNIVDNFNKHGSDVDPQFRLWLSSKPDPSFPISILQAGIKMTVEPPRGVKANLLRNLTASAGAYERTYEGSSCNQVAWRNLLVGLCFFNAVIHERKKFGRLGWNIPYEFNDSDLEVSVLELELLLTAHDHIPWPALWYLTGDVTFGGRVTDDWDSRCLRSLLQKFYHPLALKEGYCYSSDEVYQPIKGDETHEQVRAYIEQLPTQDTPELFGMNSNAQQASLEAEAKELVNVIVGVQPKLTTGLIGSGKSSDEVVLDIIADILRIMPRAIEVDEQEVRPGLPGRLKLSEMVQIANSDSLPSKYSRSGKKQESDGGGISKKDKPAVPNDDTDKTVISDVKHLCKSALFAVLRQETDRFNHLLTIIHSSLNTLMLAVKGEVVMSELLEEAYTALLTQKVPAQWKAASYESCKPLASWVKDLIERVDFFGEWLERVTVTGEKIIKPPSFITAADKSAPALTADSLEDSWRMMQPYSFWLPAFFFPQGFLTAVLQNHARRAGVSVDSLSFAFRVHENPDDTKDSLNDVKQKINAKEAGFKNATPPKDGVLVFGLFLDGARWDLTSHSLSDSLPGQRFCCLPEVHFMPSMDPELRPTSANLESPATIFKARQDLTNGDVKESYDCPLYRTSTRAGTLSSTGHSTNFVTSVKLPTDQATEFWVMRGVALLCQLDE